MTNVLRLTLLAAAMSGVLTAPAFAGGGSTKSKPDLTVENDRGFDVYVIVDPHADLSAQLVAALGGGETFMEAFGDRGGVLIEEGDDHVFENLPKGDHEVCYADAEVVDNIVANADPNNPGAAADAIEAEFDCGEVEVNGDTTFHLSDVPDDDVF